MPLYVVRCTDCMKPDRRVIPGPFPHNLTCRKCGGIVVREPQNPTVHVKEVLNLPHMQKPIERFTDAEKLYEDRSKMDPRKPPGT